MNLKRLINKAIKTGPPASLAWVYGDYYSPYYHLMYLLAGTVKNGLLAELGVHKGRGLASLAAGSKSNFVIGMDTDPGGRGLEEVLSKFGNTWFWLRPSLPVSDYFTGKKINILHIDTEHSHAMAQAEFEAYQPYLAKGAFVLFDDLHAQNDGVKAYFDSLPYEKVEDDRLHPSCGYGVLVYE